MLSTYPTRPPKAPASTFACSRSPSPSDDAFSVSSCDIEPSSPIPKPAYKTIVDKIISIYLRLAAQKNLRPGPVVNGLFGELMAICLIPCPDQDANLILNDSRVQDVLPHLHTLCSKSEFEMEKYWAERITEAQDPVQELKQFTYYENYVDLTRLELAALSAVDTREIRSVAFIGSGPLPLTSLCLLEQLGRKSRSASSSARGKGNWTNWVKSLCGCEEKEEEGYGISVLNIDHDAKAIDISTTLCRSLSHIAHGMEFQLGEASSSSSNTKDRGVGTDLTPFDVVFLAALVGSTQNEKEKVLKDVVARMRRGSLLVVRSVHGLRGLCYQGFDASCEGVGGLGRDGEGGCLELAVQVRPFGVVVNSVVVGRVR